MQVLRGRRGRWLLRCAVMLAIGLGIASMQLLSFDQVPATAGVRGMAEAVGGGPPALPAAVDQLHTKPAQSTPADNDGTGQHACAGCLPSDGAGWECVILGCVAALVAIAVGWLTRPRLRRRWWLPRLLKPRSLAISTILRAWVRPGPSLVALSISRT